MSRADPAALPLVYSCSGCSNAAQMANYIAVQLNRRGVAEMSCIAGVGGDVAPLVKTATSGRPVFVIDGCHLACSKQCLSRHAVEPDHYLVLTEHGVRKRTGFDYDPEQADAMLTKAIETLSRVPVRQTD